MNSSPKIFLLDAYALIYRAYYAFIKNPRINSKGLNTSAILGFVNTLEEVLERERPTHVGVAIDPHGPTFRHEAYPAYKAQRQSTPEDIRKSVPIIRQILSAYRIPVLEVQGFEADDVIGTLATQASALGLKTYMMTPDKDYGQLVSEHVHMYRPKHSGGFEDMGPEEVKAKYGLSSPHQVIDMLGLMGDTSDNIPGCPGVGEKTAQKLLAEFGSIDNLLSHTDSLKGALKRKVEENRQSIEFSRFLATIRTDVPLRLDLSLLELKEPDMDALHRLFDQLEFRTLLKRVSSRRASTSHIIDDNPSDDVRMGNFRLKGSERLLGPSTRTLRSQKSVAAEQLDLFSQSFSSEHPIAPSSSPRRSVATQLDLFASAPLHGGSSSQLSKQSPSASAPAAQLLVQPTNAGGKEQEVVPPADLDIKETQVPQPARVDSKASQASVSSLGSLPSGPSIAAVTNLPAAPYFVTENSLFSPDGSSAAEKSILTAFDSTKVKYHLVVTEGERDEILQKLLTTEILSFDTETTDTEPMRAELVGMSFSVREGEAFYLPVPPDRQGATAIVRQMSPLFENRKILKVGQNIKYDMVVLRQYGVDVCGPLFDTMLAHYVLQPELRHNMDYLAEVYLRYRPIPIEALIGSRGKDQKSMRDLPPEDVYNYACEDADITLRLYHVLDPVLRQKGLYGLFSEVEMPLVPVLVRLESNGVRLDTSALQQISIQLTERLGQIERDIYHLAGTSFNIASPRQVGEVLFDRLHIVEKAKRTKTGQYVTSEEVLESLRARHPIVGHILDHRGLKKLLGTYVDALPQLVNPRTGRVHTSFNQAVTATGRLSSSNPNLQNIPVRDADGKEIRKAFIADEGCAFFSADYSQIELRIMAHLSGDQGMIEAFNSGHDIHAATAARIHHVDLQDVTPEMRRKAKTANFGIIYGISAFGLAERMGVSRKEARDLIDGYFATYPGVKAYMDSCINGARERGYVETLLGRKRYLPDITSRNATVRGYAERNAINAPIQGSAADIIKIAMVHIHQKMVDYKLKAKMILQVHDELNFSVPLDERSVIQQIVIEEMERAYPLLVPLKADFGWGNNWLEAH